MSYRRIKQAIFSAAIVGMLVCVPNIVNAATPVNWMSGTPTVRELQAIEAPIYGNQRCTNVHLNVVRNYTPHDEAHCMIQTSYGLIAKDMTVLQPPGYTRAYPLEVRSGFGVFMPIPNHPGVLKTGGGGFSAGNSLRMYTNFFDTIRVSPLGQSPKFIQEGEPDYGFKYANGSNRHFNAIGTVAFSENGRYFVVDDVREGYLKINTSSLEVEEFSNTQPHNTSAGTYYPASNTIASDGTMAIQAYNAPRGWGAEYFKVIDTENCVNLSADPGYGKSNRNCPTRDLNSVLQQAIPGLDNVDKVQIVNERSLTIDVTVAEGNGYAYKRYAITAPNQPERLLDYLALGDSFAAGQGAGSYREGTDISLNRCHQSLVSYPHLFARHFNSSASVACSGAKLHNIFFKENEGGRSTQITENREIYSMEAEYARTSYLPGYLQQSSFVNDLNPNMMTISIGGNDIKFAEKVKMCADPRSAENVATCFATYEDRVEIVKEINDRLPRLRQTFTDLLANDTERKLYVVGYPQIAKPGGNCGANVMMNEFELQGAEDLITYLNKIIKLAANEAGAYYVDVEDAFYGYRLCEGSGSSIAVNGASVSFDQGKLFEVTESFHPNILGHELLGAAIRSKTQQFTKTMPTPPAAQTKQQDLLINDSIDFLQNIPSTGRVVRDVFLDTPDIITPTLVEATQILTNTTSAMLKPSTSYELELHSTPLALGTFTTDAAGVLTGTYTIPRSVEPGLHTLHLYGKDVFGNDIDIQQTLYVAASEQDIDGDGILNDRDVCVGDQDAADVDKDNIPDTCDPLIDDAPTVLPENQVSINSVLSTNSATVLAHTALPGSQQVLPSNTLRLGETAAVSQNSINKPKVSATAIAGKSSHDTNKQWVVTALAGIGLFALVYVCRRFIM